MTTTVERKTLETKWIDPGRVALLIVATNFGLGLRRHEVQKLLDGLTSPEHSIPTFGLEDCDRSVITAFVARGGPFAVHASVGHAIFSLTPGELVEWTDELQRRLAEPADPDAEDEDDEDE
jgi:hypothetical protein